MLDYRRSIWYISAICKCVVCSYASDHIAGILENYTLADSWSLFKGIGNSFSVYVPSYDYVFIKSQKGIV